MTEEILIVDDEPDIRALISLSLEDEAFSLQCRPQTGRRPEMCCPPASPSAAILDIWMRESDMRMGWNC